LKIGVVVKFLGFLIFVITVWMAVPTIYAIADEGDDISGFVKSLAISAAVSSLFVLSSRKARMDGMGTREALASVALSWVAASAVGGLPYWFHGSAPTYTDSFFEAMSGFTTTGSTILEDIDSTPRGLLLWRGLTHWLGGMGIIMLTLTVMPLMGVGGFQMYKAEAPGMEHEKLTPRVRNTAVILWLIYMALTIVLTLLLLAGGMDLYDAVTHSMGTISTGGFSPLGASIAGFDNAYFEWVITVFMFISGANFSLHYRLIKDRSLSRFLSDPEFKFYLASVSALCLAVSGWLYASRLYGSVADSLRFGTFQVVSLVTSTGFVSADYEQWPSFTKSLLFLCFLMGGCAGSTSGGIKHIRLLVMFRHVGRHIRKTSNPRAILPIQVGGESLRAGVVSSCLAFLGLYLIVFSAGVVLISISEPDLFTSMSAVAATLGNVGPGFGSVGPTMSFTSQTQFAKWVYSFLMLCGRLELYTVLVLFSRAFWRGGVAL
jgi:trk system potassium uptake protein TrkH